MVSMQVATVRNLSYEPLLGCPKFKILNRITMLTYEFEMLWTLIIVQMVRNFGAQVEESPRSGFQIVIEDKARMKEYDDKASRNQNCLGHGEVHIAS